MASISRRRYSRHLQKTDDTPDLTEFVSYIALARIERSVEENLQVGRKGGLLLQYKEGGLEESVTTCIVESVLPEACHHEKNSLDAGKERMLTLDNLGPRDSESCSEQGSNILMSNRSLLQSNGWHLIIAGRRKGAK